jgi:hypothetical protein
MQEADEISLELDKVKKSIDDDIFSDIIVQGPRSSAEVKNAYQTLANDLISSELSANDKHYSEIICDSQTESDGEKYRKPKLVSKKAPKRLPRQDSAIYSTKPRISIKYNPSQRSNLTKYIDIIEDRKRRRG